MLHTRTPYLIAAAALVAGAGAGAGSYAAFGSNGANTTTVVQQASAKGSPAAATQTMSVNGVYKSAGPGVVEITSTTSSTSSDNSPFPFGGSQKSQAQGSGFVYDSAGHIVTNKHVIANASAISVTFSDGSKYSATVVGAAINHGNSGGPLLNMSGQVVGINTQIESDSGGNEGVGFAVPSRTISTVASKLVSGQKVQHPYLGVYVGTPANRSGAQINQVKSGSPAASAGLKAGDVITTFDGQTIQSPEDLTAAVGAKAPGDKVTVTYVRNGSTKTAQVTIGTRPS